MAHPTGSSKLRSGETKVKKGGQIVAPKLILKIFFMDRELTSRTNWFPKAAIMACKLKRG